MTKDELILLLQNSPHSGDTQVVVFLNEDENLEDCIGDIALIDSVDTDISDRIDLNVVYESAYLS